MKKMIVEAFIAVMVIGAAAEVMQGLWWASVNVMREPLDKIFIAAASMCYVFFRVSDKKMFRDD